MNYLCNRKIAAAIAEAGGSGSAKTKNINQTNKKIGIMKELKGTKTEKNLLEAFAGESQARNKYSYFASRAKKDGYEQVS